MAKRLYVGNLPYTVSEPELRDLFSQAGEVESVTVIVDRDTRQGKGFAFVEMKDDDASKKAIDTFNGYKMEERSIVVNEARPKEDRGYDRGGSSGGFKGGRSNRRSRTY
jgi:cold-inducible RNA-binding protein